MAKIEYLVQRKHMNRNRNVSWMRSAMHRQEGHVWTGYEANAVALTDQTMAEHLCDGFKDYFASKGYPDDVVVVERMTLDDGTQAHAEVYG